MNGSIELIEGSLGSGKSAFAFERVMEHLGMGGYCFTNIKHHADLLAGYFSSLGLVFEPDRLVYLEGSMKDFHSRVARGNKDMTVMVVIDEAHLDFNAMDWALVDRDLVNFATLCRKFDITLLFITQDKDNVVKQFRRMVQTLFHCRNMRQFRLFGMIPMPIPLFVRIRYDCTMGSKPQRLDPELLWKSPSWGYYDSDALLGPSAQKFASMTRLNATPLKKCKPTPPPLLSFQSPFPLLETLAAGLTAMIFFV